MSSPVLTQGASAALPALSRHHGEEPGAINQLFPEIICQSPEMFEVLHTVAKVAASQSSVLLLGASGTGKELIAAAIHRLSRRINENFIALNCSAIPESLLEAELFGYEKGAFTGAEKQRLGLFAMANHGTMFLDEISEMPLLLQAKLLRVLQEKKFLPLGAQKTSEANVRIIAATNCDLFQAVQDQRFRLDLFYRLNVLPITLPALKERRGDILLLIEHFLQKGLTAYPEYRPCFFDAECLALLAHYDWPGNVRELQNLVERCIIMGGGGELSKENLPREIRGFSQQASSCPLPEKGLDLNKLVHDLENSLIQQALERCNYNKNLAAKLLGLNRTTLVERIKKRGLSI